MKNKGFTLIELVVVIVILGILAVTAAPKFLNLQEDARKSSLQGLKGAMAGAAGIVYGKAAIQGDERSSAAVPVDGIQTVYGYPTAASNGIGLAVTGLTEDWKEVTGIAGLPTDPEMVVYTFNGQDSNGWSTNSGCFVKYAQATGTGVTENAKATVVDDKC
ncbi:type II secretion system protein [Vibrio astriarenae]